MGENSPSRSQDILRVDARTAVILREAYHKIDTWFRNDRFGLYEYTRAVVTKLAPVDTIFFGFLQGTDRVRYTYEYDSGNYDDPQTHSFGPLGQTAWLLRHRRTYRYAYDNGAALNAGVPCGDTGRRSADAITVPLFRAAGNNDAQLFGMMSVQSYQANAFDDNAVRAFEWLAALVARVISRESEDRDALRHLPAGEYTPTVLTSDSVVEYLSARIAELRHIAGEARRVPQAASDPVRGHLDRLVKSCEKVQTELIEMTLDADEGPEKRYASLTPTQQRVAVLLTQGLANERLAAELAVSRNTVKTHLSAILRKYGMEHRAQVADDVRRYLTR